MNAEQLSVVLEAQQQVVVKISLGSSLKECLIAISTFIEPLLAAPPVCSSIVFLEGDRLRHGASLRLPELYSDAIDGEIVGPNSSPCSAAAFSKKQVIVSDIENDPQWGEHKEYALRCNLKAFWTTPVTSSENKILGCVTVYYSQPTTPSHNDLDLLYRFSSLSALAIEKFQSTQKNKQLTAKLIHSNEKFRAFNQVMPDLSLIIDEDLFFVDFYGAGYLLSDYPKNRIGGHLSDILTAQKLKQVSMLINAALKSNKMQLFEYETSYEYKYEYEHQTYKGRRTFEVRALMIRNYLVDNPQKKHVLLQARDITQSKKIRCVLKEKEERLSLATSSNGVGIWDWNLQTGERVWDDTMFALYRMRKETFLSDTQAWEKCVHPDDVERRNREIQAALADETAFDTEYRICWPNGEIRHIKSKAKVFRDQAGHPLRMLGTNMDISETKKSQEKLKLAASVFTHSGQSICITDPQGKIIEVNDNFNRLTGYEREDVLGKTPRILRSGYHSPDFYEAMWESLLKKGFWHGETWNRRKNGEVYPGTLSITCVRNDAQQVINYVGFITDITQAKAHQGQLEHMVYFDTLTNLPNRVLLADRLSQAMARSEQKSCLLAVAFIDLDGFKAINDKFGHKIGDQLLIILSKRMKKVLRENETLARLGGDEFVVVLTDFYKIEDCKQILERLLEVVSSPVSIAKINTKLELSASIGVTIYPQDDVDVDLLIRHADQAMYIAKQEGKNRYHIFDTVLNVELQYQHKSLQRIRNALQNDEFVLYYQPKVNMKTGTVVGVEALIRWMHPEQGLIMPNDFLPIIQNHSLSLELDGWVINRALKQISEWQRAGLCIPVSVNISVLQLQQKKFVIWLTELLAAHPEVSPKLLQLEVLETSELSDVNDASKIMQACIKLGVSFALDDFGTGYSSLTYLRRLPANLIKIDQTFIRDMLEDSDDMAIVEGVIGLAKSFKREVIAEGVETIEHGVALLLQGCDLAQGYGIAKPMPAADLHGWIGTWQTDQRWLGMQ